MTLTRKYRLKDKSAKKCLLRHAYAVNQVWNYCVSHQIDVESRNKAGSKPRFWASSYDLQSLCKGVGKELGIYQQTIGWVCHNFAKDRNKIKRAPKFRSSFGLSRSLGWVPFSKESCKIEDNSVTYFGKTYRWFGNKRRFVGSTIKCGSFVEDTLGRWWVCFQVEISNPRKGLVGQVGIDQGLKSLATLSNGCKIKSLQFYKHSERKIITLQRAKRKRQVRRAYAHVSNCRHDFLHKLSTQLTRDYAFIAVGNVNPIQLAKTRLAKSVYDASWSTFRQMLKYKASTYVEVDEKFTTQTCSHCGSKDSKERPRGIAGLGIREWECSDCGTHHDRDVNAAKNILALALSTQRPVEESLFVRAG